MSTFFRIAISIILAIVICNVMPGDGRSDDYQDFLKSHLEEFQEYKDKRDAEFVGFLKDQWKEYSVDKGLVSDTEPKPVKLPVAEPSKAPVLPEKLKKVKPVKPIDIPEKKPEPHYTMPEKPSPFEKTEPVKPFVKPLDKVIEPPVKPEKPVVEKKPEPPVVPEEKKVVTPVPMPKPSQLPPKPEKRKVAIKTEFYKMPVVIFGTYDFPAISGSSVNKDMIASFWDKMSQIDYDSIVLQSQKYKKDLNLNDWGYHYVLYRLGLEQYRGDKNMANLFTWYISAKAGYESRIGYNQSQIFLLMPSNSNLYSIPFLTLNNKKYYALFYDQRPSTFKSLFTYQGNYPDADRLVDFNLYAPPEIPKVTEKRKLVFEVDKKAIELEAMYNKNIVDFFKYYPQTSMRVYFESFMSPELESTLITALKPLVEGKTEAEAINNLLTFVQKAFSYKTDDDQFGHEKYMIPEETIFYPYSDCEDRSFFFAYLVRKLTGLEVVGLDYPGHVATAVRFSDNLPGDYVVSNNVKYMVCDPTYINATLGMAMPQYKKTKPEIVQIKSM